MAWSLARISEAGGVTVNGVLHSSIYVLWCGCTADASTGRVSRVSFCDGHMDYILENPEREPIPERVYEMMHWVENYVHRLDKVVGNLKDEG
jgi:hypothetical protein